MLTFKFEKPIFKNTLYLDKDGVLNDVVIRDNKLSSPRHLSELILDNNLFELNQKITKKLFNTVIVSNQPDLSRGLINKDFLLETLNSIRKYLTINVAYFCPHTSDQKCQCRKPKPGMIIQHRKMFPNSFDTEYYIGDTDKDFLCAKKLKINFVFRLHKFNKKYSILAQNNISKLKQLSF